MSKKCTTNPEAPLPPCPKGYVEYTNENNEQCCKKKSKDKEEKPKKEKKSKDNEDEEKPKKEKKVKKSKDNEDEEKPKKEKKSKDEDEEKPKKEKKSKDNEDEEKSKKEKKVKKSKDEDEEKPKKEKKVKKSKDEDEEKPKKEKKSKKEKISEEDEKPIKTKSKLSKLNDKIDKLETRFVNHEKTSNSWIYYNRPDFTTFINKTFHPYDAVSTSKEFNLFPHQRFVRDYLQYKSPYRGILLYHGLGVGKTCSSIAAAEMLINFKQVIVMLPASLKINYINEVKKCGNIYYASNQYWKFYDIEDLDTVIKYISPTIIKKHKGVWLPDPSKESNYDSLNDTQKKMIGRQLDDIIQNRYEFIHYNGLKETSLSKYEEGYFDNKVIIIDEVHNFISAVTNQSKVIPKLYNKLVNSKNSKFILLSGTPIINKPVEIAHTMQLIKGPTYLHVLTVESNKSDEVKDLLMTLKTVDNFSMTQVSKKNMEFNILFVPNHFIKGKKKLKFIENVTDHDYTFNIIIKLLESKKIKYSNVKTVPYPPLPLEEEEFDKFFIDEDNLKMKNIEMFKRRTIGSFSYYNNPDPSVYPSFKVINEECVFSSHQLNKYLAVRTDELKREQQANKQKAKGVFNQNDGSYKTFSRAICNFAFPEKVARPYPKDVNDMNKFDFEKNEDEEIDEEEYMDYKNLVVRALKKIKKNQQDYLVDNLNSYSCKFDKIMKNITKTEGKVLVYSQFRTVEGLGLLGMTFKAQGYKELKIKRVDDKWTTDFEDDDSFRFVHFKPDDNLSNELKIDYTNIVLNIYNNSLDKLPKSISKSFKGSDNLRGDIVKFIFITQSGAEGISLKHVRQVHIMEPYWNNNRIDQVIGRANRAFSHVELPEKERNFTVYKYYMSFGDIKIDQPLINNKDKLLTTDQIIQNIANKKTKIVNEFLKAMKETAVDCHIHHSVHSKHDMNFKCFTFPVNMDSNEMAYTVDINDEIIDKYSDIGQEQLNEFAQKVTINFETLNKEFIYIPKTKELFNYGLYMSTNILELVGRMEKQDDHYIVSLKSTSL